LLRWTVLPSVLAEEVHEPLVALRDPRVRAWLLVYLGSHIAAARWSVDVTEDACERIWFTIRTVC
jgi:hypothetical protein